MKKQKTKQDKTLEILKKRYYTKYVEPLLSFFTKPPKLFDSCQIRLRKQIEKSLEELENARLCGRCSGQGVTVKKVIHVIDMEKTWKQLSTSDNGDTREIALDVCAVCFGHGIVLRPSKCVGSVFRHEQIFKMKCHLCKHQISVKENCLFAYCEYCPASYNLESLGYRIIRVTHE
jgi:hypothetical protein